jgi:hypothetical protein
MKLLVLTSEPITAEQLRAAVGVDTDPAATEVVVIAPALAENPVKFWFSDVDEAIARAAAIRAETVQRLAAHGVSARGDTGESDPVQAIADALETFPADRIIVFTHGESEGRRYREDIDDDELRERFGLPVDRAAVS